LVAEINRACRATQRRARRSRTRPRAVGSRRAEARAPGDHGWRSTRANTSCAHRGPVVGRKNHYGSKSRRGTQVAATLYAILETVKLHAIDPAAYLLAAAIAGERGETLLPWELATRT